MSGSTVPRDAAAVGTSVVAPDAAFVSGDSYHNKRGSLAYENNNGRFGYTLQGYARRVDFITLDLDYHEGGGQFTWNWIYSGTTRFNVRMDYTRRAFDSFVREDKGRNFGADVVFQVNSNVTIMMQGSREERQSTVPLGSYVDNRVMLVLGYSTASLYQVQSRR
jgi:hypothetical protein